MPAYRFWQVDVFTARPFGGNPLAVFPDAAGLDSAQMQAIAREMNLSETTFVVPSPTPQADFAVRIFTPEAELPFAGHPVIGTHWVLAHLGRVALREPLTTVRFALGVGVRAATLHVQAGRVTQIVMDHQVPVFGATASPAQLDQLARGLGLDPAVIRAAGAPVQVVSTGLPQLFVPLHRLADLQALSPRHQDSAALNAVMQALDPQTHCSECLMVLTRDTADPAVTVRTRLFAPGLGVPEDPATGSASGGLGAYLVRHGLVRATPPITTIVSAQGVEMGRPSTIHVYVEGTPEAIAMVRVGGAVVPVIEGVLRW